MSIRYAREVNPICGDCFASSANRCCFVDTGLEFRCIRRSSLQRIHNPTPRFPPRSPGGARVRALSVLSRRYDFLPSLPPHFVAFAWRYHSSRLAVRSHQHKTQRWWAGGISGSATPTDAVVSSGDDRISQVPGRPPMPIRSGSSTPAGLHAPCRGGAAVRPPREELRGLLHWDFRSSIARLLGSLSTLRGPGCPAAT